MPKVIVIVGPTGVGKTKLSIELAKKLNGEIINADSTQVYRGLNIATAKVKEDEMQGIKHHLLDIRNLDEEYNVFDYQQDARLVIDQLLASGKTPILVGGTGLYIKAALYDYQFSHEDVKDEYLELSDDQVYAELKAVDSNTNIHPNNRKRVVRSLNYFNSHQVPFSNKMKDERLIYEVLMIGLTTDRDCLYKVINQRVDLMMVSGLLAEANALYMAKERSRAVLTPIGYKELFPYFHGDITLEEALKTIKQSSRKYAKRQYTWFNHQLDVTWFKTNYEDFDSTVNEVLEYIKKNRDLK